MNARTETVDRVVASVGRSGITRSDVIKEYQMEQFLGSGRVPSQLPDAIALDQSRTRLIDQKLLAGEISSYLVNPALLREAALKQVAELRARFKTGAEFQSALRLLGVTQTQLRKRLERDQHILLMINTRMRPAAVVSQNEIQDYYERTFLPKASRLGRGAPLSLSAVQNQIREILVQEKINRLLDEWLKELREEHQVRILPQ
ncbi:MAG TPA: hypothetical protein VKV79_04345 [Terriglobia bacterium]|nr:hypothetical protein [Terriglobia bacterium]